MASSPSTITVRVRDQSGRAVAGARIFFLNGPQPLPEIAALTNQQGECVLTLPKPGDYRIACATDSGQAEASVTAGAMREVEIRVG